MRKNSSQWDAARLEGQFETLARLFAEGKKIEDFKALLSTLLTASEKAAIGQRLEIIRRLQKGEIYADICLALGASSTTITRAQDLYHKNGQHNAAFNRLLENFVFEAKIPEPKSTGFDPQGKNMGPGFRQYMRDNKK